MLTVNDADGYLDIQIDGKEKPVRIDLFIANDTIIAAMEGVQGGEEVLNRYKEIAVKLGFGEVSSRSAKFIIEAIFERVDQLRKKG